MKIFLPAKEYLPWRLRAKSRHGTHSPFLYKFLDQCLYADRNEAAFIIPETHRKNLRKDHTVISYPDPGAGSRLRALPGHNPAKQVEIRHIARTSLQKPSYCRLYYRMVRYFGYGNILELGTSLGVTTSYMSLANTAARIHTIEGAEPIATYAKDYFRRHNFPGITLFRGNFDNVLEDIVAGNYYDMVFIDGNHKGEKVLEYFSLLTKHIHKGSVIIVDDIRWSNSMLRAWRDITASPLVTLSLDLFHTGMVFFDTRLSKENFCIKF